MHEYFCIAIYKCILYIIHVKLLQLCFQGKQLPIQHQIKISVMYMRLTGHTGNACIVELMATD